MKWSSNWVWFFLDVRDPHFYDKGNTLHYYIPWWFFNTLSYMLLWMPFEKVIMQDWCNQTHTYLLQPFVNRKVYKKIMSSAVVSTCCVVFCVLLWNCFAWSEIIILWNFSSVVHGIECVSSMMNDSECVFCVATLSVYFWRMVSAETLTFLPFFFHRLSTIKKSPFFMFFISINSQLPPSIRLTKETAFRDNGDKWKYV